MLHTSAPQNLHVSIRRAPRQETSPASGSPAPRRMPHMQGVDCANVCTQSIQYCMFPNPLARQHGAGLASDLDTRPARMSMPPKSVHTSPVSTCPILPISNPLCWCEARRCSLQLMRAVAVTIPIPCQARPPTNSSSNFLHGSTGDRWPALKHLKRICQAGGGRRMQRDARRWQLREVRLRGRCGEEGRCQVLRLHPLKPHTSASTRILPCGPHPQSELQTVQHAVAAVAAACGLDGRLRSPPESEVWTGRPPTSAKSCALRGVQAGRGLRGSAAAGL